MSSVMTAENNAGIKTRCDYCHNSCKPLRCTKCRLVVYCSRNCQAAHWKAGHARQCRKHEKRQKNKHEQAAAAALMELQATLKSASLQDAFADMTKAQAHVTEELQKDQTHQQQQFQQQHNQDVQNLEPKETLSSKDTKQNGPLYHSPEEERIEPQAGTNRNEQRSWVGKTTVENSSEKNGTTSAKSRSDTFYVAVRDCDSRRWKYAMEVLTNVSCLHLTVVPADAETSSVGVVPPVENIQVSFHKHDNTTIVRLNENNCSTLILSLILCDSIQLVPDQVKLAVEQSSSSRSCISLRLFCQSLAEDNVLQSISDDYGQTPPLSSKEEVQRLHCKSCHHSLVTQSIRRVLPLPSGYWDEVADYLICYSGQSLVNFTSSGTTVEPGLVLEDTSVIVFHKDTLGPNVCVLALEGYGEGDDDWDGASSLSETEKSARLIDDSVEYRGNRHWRDVVGGATVCCSQCCSQLGFASIEMTDSFRLLKHRLDVSTTTSPTDNAFGQRHTCASFVASEMVRYAESKGVFTFVLAVNGGHNMDPSSAFAREYFATFAGNRRRCLLIRLINWDAFMATREDELTESTTASDGTLHFSKIVKVIYEEAEDLYDGKAASSAEALGDDMTNWTWGGVDLCCRPLFRSSGNVNNQLATQESTSCLELVPQGIKGASVRLHLAPDEWIELKKSLIQGASYSTSSVRDAMFLMKLGRMCNPEQVPKFEGLSTLPFSSV